MTEEPSIATQSPDQEWEPDSSVRETFARLYSDGRAYADAEIERQKLRVGLASTGIRDAAIYGVAGFLIVFAGLVAFLVGLTLVLAPYLGAGWAAVAVFGSSLLVAFVLLLLAKARITRMKKAIRS